MPPLLVLPWILLLAACVAAPVQPPLRLIAPTTTGGRLCVRQCREAQDHAEAYCLAQQRGCTDRMQAQAIKDYERYAREQLLVQEPLDLRPRDFERPALCSPAVCRQGHEEAYRRCFTGCGGAVTGAANPPAR